MEYEAIVSRIKRGKNLVLIISIKKGNKMFGFAKPIYRY